MMLQEMKKWPVYISFFCPLGFARDELTAQENFRTLIISLEHGTDGSDCILYTDRPFAACASSSCALQKGQFATSSGEKRRPGLAAAAAARSQGQKLGSNAPHRQRHLAVASAELNDLAGAGECVPSSAAAAAAATKSPESKRSDALFLSDGRERKPPASQ
ncbi:hypothetical protein GUJ93_ZPchr0005g15998 [Zizania palustris]|uniref:Uncharacterized protein n=1 Tax=Zizania palustris TaxID=103762 RepID=A0A8J5VRG9_ZIZPA|nr:hypothetical protein GUJ93_ZPchr0005g15998 [Zizania palustris]